MGEDQVLQDVADDSAQETTNDHRRNVNSGRDFDSEGYRGKEGLDHERNAKGGQETFDLVGSLWAESGGFIRAAGARQFKKELCDGYFGIPVPETHETSHQGN